MVDINFQKLQERVNIAAKNREEEIGKAVDIIRSESSHKAGNIKSKKPNNKNVRKRSLKTKIMILCVLLVAGTMLAAIAIGATLIFTLLTMSNSIDSQYDEIIRQESGELIMDLTKEGMMKVVSLSAEETDEEFWTLRHDLTVLANQTESVLEDPERYGEAPVSPPKLENEGKYALQLLFPDDKVRNDPDAYVLPGKVANLAPMMEEIIRGTSDTTRDCFIAFPDGVTLAMDMQSEQKIDEDGNVRDYDPRKRPWYENAVKSGDFQFTYSQRSIFSDKPEVEYSMPVYVDGKLAAVLKGSIGFDTLSRSAADATYGIDGFSILISSDDMLVYSPRETGELSMNGEPSVPLRGNCDQDILNLLDESKYQNEGFGTVTIDGKEYNAAYARMDTLGWIQMTFAAKGEMDSSVVQLFGKMDEAKESTKGLYSFLFVMVMIITAAVIILILFIALLAAGVLSGRVLRPVGAMTEKINSLTGERFEFDMEDVYRTGDEIEVLAETFEDLSGEMDYYLKEILDFTAERERSATELDIASRIQTNMLPQDFPLFPDRDDFSLYASMDPAREVGGDFYDAFMVDDDHLCMVIADVCDKGIPAAFFMVVSKVLLKYRAKVGGSPAEILADVNNRLTEGNDEMMFVTVWLAVITLSTGEVIEANAGHECPVVRRKGGKFELLSREHGFVLGNTENMKYENDVFTLEKGDTIFVYTDGLVEASNASDERFGMERMMDALDGESSDDPEVILERMKATVEDFVKGAPQFDDLTMMAMTYHGTE